MAPGGAARDGRFALQTASALNEVASILLLLPVLGLVENGDDGFVVRLPSDGALGAVTQGGTIGLPFVLLAVVALLALAAVLNRWRAIHTADLLYRLVNEIRMDLSCTIARARRRVFADMRSADLTHVLTGDIDRVNTAASAALSAAQNGVLILIYLGVSLLISPGMTLFAAAAGALILIVLTPIRHRAQKLGASVADGRRSQCRTVADFVDGMKAAKLHHGEMRRIDEMERTLTRMRGDMRRFGGFSSWGTVAIQVFNAAGLAVFVLIALALTDIRLPELAVLFFVFMRIAPRFLVVQGMAQHVL